MFEWWRKASSADLRTRPTVRAQDFRRRNRARDGASVALRWLPATAALFGGMIFLILSGGGRTVREAEPLIVQLDRLAARVGLGLNKISLTGYEMTADRDVFAALGLQHARSLIAFDAASARHRIEALPWIAEARIKRTFPHRLDIAVQERRPFALWRHGGHDILIDRNGRLLTSVRTGAVQALPMVTGAGAPEGAGLIMGLIRQWPGLTALVRQADFIDQRRWNLQLADGRSILLPEMKPAQAIRSLMLGQQGRRLIDRAFEVADFRLAGSIVLRRHRPKLRLPGSARTLQKSQAFRG